MRFGYFDGLLWDTFQGCVVLLPLADGLQAAWHSCMGLYFVCNIKLVGRFSLSCPDMYLTICFYLVHFFVT